jgi:hypothetical protein
VALVCEESVSGVTGGTAAGSIRRTHPCASISSATTESRCVARRRLHSMTARLPLPRTRNCTAPLSGKRLLALWNALPGVERRGKIGDRKALIDQLWSAIEALPDPDPQSDAKRPSKQDAVIAMLQRPEGATVDEVASATGWQRHTVRGVFSGTLKKKLGLTVASAAEERGRVYRIAAPQQA